jgi:hypothetical protein
MPKQQRIRDPLHDLIEFNVDRVHLRYAPAFAMNSRNGMKNGGAKIPMRLLARSIIRFYQLASIPPAICAGFCCSTCSPTFLAAW